MQILKERLQIRPSAGPPEGERKFARSFRLTRNTRERTQATLRGSQAKSYGLPELEAELPQSLDELAELGLQLINTVLEDALNGGKEFPRRDIALTPGPVPGHSRRRSAASATTG